MKSLHDIRDFQKAILEDCGKSAKNEERYCRLCGKREKRSVCGYGPAGWDKYSVKDATDAEKEAAAEDAGIVCLLYTSPSPRDVEESRMPSSA